MQTAYVVKGYINAQGTLVLEESVFVEPGPVLVSIIPTSTHTAQPEPANNDDWVLFWNQVEDIIALPSQLVPADGWSAKDSKNLLYGSANGTNDVL